MLTRPERREKVSLNVHIWLSQKQTLTHGIQSQTVGMTVQHSLPALIPQYSSGHMLITKIISPSKAEPKPRD